LEVTSEEGHNNLAVTGLCASAFAQFSDNFESETGSSAGTVITGQNGWYLPAGTDAFVFTYSGNTLGFPQNPSGNRQFLGNVTGSGSNPSRAQHDVTFSGGMWTVGFDFCAGYNGALPAADNLGSFSLQTSSTNYFQTIYQWGNNTGTATMFNANIGHFGSTGGSGGSGISFDSPGAAWQNLPVDHWFHQTVTWSFDTGLITDTTLQDLTANGVLNDFQPTGWYLQGGANNVNNLPLPSAVRFFAGGGQGNLMGYDNLAIHGVPEPASFAALGLGVFMLIRRRRGWSHSS